MLTKLDSQNPLIGFPVVQKAPNQESSDSIREALLKGLGELGLNVDSYDIRERGCAHIEIGLREKNREGFLLLAFQVDQKIRTLLRTHSINYEKKETESEFLQYDLEDLSLNISITDITDYNNPDSLFFEANEFFKNPSSNATFSFKSLYERASKGKDGNWIEWVSKQEKISLLKACLLFFAGKISFCNGKFLCEFEMDSVKHFVLIPSFVESDRQSLLKNFSLFANKFPKDQVEKFAEQLISECSENSDKAHFFFDQLLKLYPFIYSLPQGSKIACECMRRLELTDSFREQLDALSLVEVVSEGDALFRKDLLMIFSEQISNETLDRLFYSLRKCRRLFKSDTEKLICQLQFLEANKFLKNPSSFASFSFKDFYERVSKGKDGNWIEGMSRQEAIPLLKAFVLSFAEKISFCDGKFLCEFEMDSVKYSLLIPSFIESDRQAFLKHVSLFANKIPRDQLENFVEQLISECSTDSDKAHFFFDQLLKFYPFIYSLSQGSKITCECMRNLNLTDASREQLDALSLVAVVSEGDSLFRKDLLMSFSEQLSNETIDRFFYSLRNRRSLFKSDTEKLIWQLHSFSKENAMTPLIRGEKFRSLGILEMDSKEIRESKSLISKFFTESKQVDPFNFETNLAFLLSHGELNKALNLIRLQEHLHGFSVIQTTVQKVLQSSISKEEFQGLYFGFVEEVLAREGSEPEKLETALTAYGYLYSNPEIASLLEKRCFLGKLDSSLFDEILGRNKELKISCEKALTYRIGKRLEASQPVPVCSLLDFLSKISDEPLFISTSLVSLLDKCSRDPVKIKLALENVHAGFSREIRQRCFSGLLGLFNENEEKGGLIEAFLTAAAEEDKMVLMERTSRFTIKALDKCLNLLGETEASARFLFSRVSGGDFLREEGIAFVRRVYPYLNEADKEESFRKISGFEGFSKIPSRHYLKFVEEVLMEGKSGEEKFEIALKTYGYLYFNAEIATFLERKYLMDSPLEGILKQSESLKELCKQALTHRIKTCLAEAKPVLGASLLELLSKMSSDTSFIAKSLVSCLEKCAGNPEKTKSSLEKILQCSNEIQQQCFVGLLALFDKKEEMGDLLKPLLAVALDKDKLTLARKCIEKPGSKIADELFHASLSALSDPKKAFKESSQWNLKSLEKCFEALEKTEGVSSALFSQISKTDFLTADGVAFVKRLAPYFSETSKAECFNAAWKVVQSMISSNRSIKDMLNYLALMSTGDQNVQGKQLVSFFLDNLENLQKCLIDKSTDSVIRENAQIFIDQMKICALPLMTEDQKLQLFYKYCSSSCVPEADQLVREVAEQISDFNALKAGKWNVQRLTKGFEFFPLGSKKEKYEAFAFETCSNSIKNREDLEAYLPVIMQVDLSCFRGNPKLYAAFLKIVNLYVSSSDFSEKKSEFTRKIGEIIQEGPSLLPHMEARDQFLYQLVAFTYAAVVLKDRSLATQQVNDCSPVFLEEFSKIVSKRNFNQRDLFLSGIAVKCLKEESPETLLKSILQQLSSLQKDPSSQLPSLGGLHYLASRIHHFSTTCPDLGSQCSYMLRKILLQTGQEESKKVAFELLKEIHSNRLKKEGINPSTQLDLTAYLEFLQDLKCEQGLLPFIRENELFERDPDLFKLIRLYDKTLTASKRTDNNKVDLSPEMAQAIRDGKLDPSSNIIPLANRTVLERRLANQCDNKNIIRDLSLLQARELPTASSKEFLFALNLYLQLGSAFLEDEDIESLCDKLKEAFKRESFVFCESFSAFYTSVWKDLDVRKDSPIFIPLAKVTKDLLNKCFKECMSMTRLSLLNPEKFNLIRDSFYLMYNTYITDSFEEGSFFKVFEISEGAKFDCKNFLFEIARHLIKESNKFEDSILCWLIKMDINNMEVFKCYIFDHKLESYQMRLAFFELLRGAFPDNEHIKKHIEFQTKFIAELSYDRFESEVIARNYRENVSRELKVLGLPEGGSKK